MNVQTNDVGRAGLCAGRGRDGARPSRDDGRDGARPSRDDGRDGARSSQGLPSRKCPSKNSVLVPRDARAIVLFVTVNANKRQPVFANDKSVACIIKAWQAAANWLVGRYVVMPDHLHFFCAPGIWPVPDFHKWMSYWKSIVARTFPIDHELPLWQRECWDVQMRTVEGYCEKWDYVRNNPVRKGLVDDADKWSYQGCLNVLPWHD